MDALLEWKAAKAKLTESLYSYHNACLYLESTLSPTASTPNSSKPSDHSSFKETILDVHAQTPSMKPLVNELLESHASVNRLLNRSTPIVPIAILSPELLIHIFSLVMLSFKCYHEPRSGTDMMLVIPSVCSLWRKIAIGACALWSHIDIGMSHAFEGEGGLLNQIHLRIERSGQVPLHLHVKNISVRRPDGLANLSRIIEPHLDSLGSLDILLDSGSPDLTLQIFERFARSCSPGSGKSLTLFAPEFDNAQELILPLLSCKGLRNLRLEFTPFPVICPFDQMESIIANNVSLCSLRFRCLLFNNANSALVCSNPVSLPQLEVLDLDGLETNVTVRLLSMLVPGTSGLRLKVAISNQDELIKASVGFLKHSRVELLCAIVSRDHYTQWLIECAPFLPQLHTLVLTWAGGNSMLRQALVAEDGSPRFPGLRSLCLSEVPSQCHLEGICEVLENYCLDALLLMGFLTDGPHYENFVQKLSSCASRVDFLSVPGTYFNSLEISTWTEHYWDSLC